MKNKIAILLNYFVGYQFIYPIVLVLVATLLFGGQVLDASFILPAWYQMLFYIVFMVSMVYLAKDFLKEQWLTFKITKKWIITVLLVYGMMYLSNIVISLLLTFVTNQGQSLNQESITVMFSQMPYLTVFIAVIFAPIVEEIVFRGVIFNFFRKKGFLFAALISAVLFGLIHVRPMAISDLPFVVVYAALGFFICLGYEKTNNFYTAVTLHFLNNLLAVLVMALL